MYPNLEYGSVTYYLENADVRIVGGATSYTVSDCDQNAGAVYVDAYNGWVFSRFNEFIPFSRGVLNAARGLVEVAYDYYATNSGYLSSNDRITIHAGAIGYQFGRFTVAHEYGHAIHEKALSGNAAGGQCPAQHYLDGYYNLACAFSEGFADFVGATAQNVYDVGIYYLYIADYTNWYLYNAGADGSIQEASVAAMLYDLTDAPGGDGGASEPWDVTLGERVAATIRDCRLKYHGFTTRIRGADDFVYCAERNIDPTAQSAYFLTRPPFQRASIISSNAAASSNWPQSGVRSVWRKDLYGL